MKSLLSLRSASTEVSETAKQLISSALQLSPSDRAAVVDAILASLQPKIEGDSAADIQEAWSAEVRTRVADIDSGRVKTIPRAEAWKMIDGEADIPD